MKFTSYFIAFTSIFIFGCNNDSELKDPLCNIIVPTTDYDCEFVEDKDLKDGLLDEAERAIIIDCTENKLTSNSDIENNLIGEWELIGFGDGWYSDITQPCAYIIFNEDELIFDFKNEYLDTVSVHSWEIEETLLKVDPPESHLSMQTFSNRFMLGTKSPFGAYVIDVDQYIYEKVK